MKYTSTRDRNIRVGFEEAVFRGLAPDGGLYVPAERVDISQVFKTFTEDTSFMDVSIETASALFGGEPGRDTVERICRKAFSFEPVLSHPEEGLHILELYHGPSCAFKDYGASFLASCMEEFLEDRDQSAVILTATSGDTGSAVAQAFHGRKQIDVVILYPSGRVSPLQEKQLTTLGGNVAALEVEGSFDDCQKMVKETFVDPDLSQAVPLTSANSINLGRLIPQSFYYIWAVSRIGRPDLRICVPSGNFGNLTAAVMAHMWGLPVTGFIAATNRNDVVPEYLLSGRYTPRPSIKTLSNAMDVGDPSNFERLLYLFDNDRRRMAELISGEVVSDEKTLEVIREVWTSRGEYIDPHTAVGYLASRRRKDEAGGSPILLASTAHPGKFLEIVKEATGTRPPLPERLSRVLDLPKTSVRIKPTKAALADYLTDRFS